VVLWGGIYPGAKLGLRGIPVMSFTSLRLLVAGGILFPRDLLPAVLNAGLVQTTFQLLLIAGLHRTTAGHSAILLATAPLITATWLAFTKREPLTRRQLGGLLLDVGGVALVVRHAGGASDLIGDAIPLAAAGAWAWSRGKRGAG
jgi:drug/metabolite transporter (DMT)-like permease